MLHPLAQRIDALRSRVRRQTLLDGVGWSCAVVLATLVGLGGIDYLIRFDDSGIRVLAALTFWGVVAGAVYRYLYLPLHAELGDVRLALRLQRRFPVLGDSLASAVEFLRQSDEDRLAGSVAMRRAVVAQATADTEDLDFAQAVDRQPATRALMAAVAVGLVGLILLALNPTASGVALVRLLNPFGTTAWPRTTHLQLRERVERVARGQDFEVEVTEQSGRLPAEVRIEYRFTDDTGRRTDELERMHLLNGAMVARREGVVRPFSYRISGGDDHSLPWTDVAVLEPPRVESIEITLTPPAYTGWPAEAVQQPLRALAGSSVSIAARASKPLRQVELCLEGGTRLPGRIEADGQSFVVPAASGWMVEKSATYWLELTDTEKLLGGRDDRWDIRVVADAPPTVSIERPTTNVFVTPQAIVPLRVMAKDDLAIQSIALAYSRSDKGDAPETTVPLYTGPAQPAVGTALPGEPDSGDSQTVEHPWSLEELQLAPGMQVTFHAVASDYRPQSAKSDARRLVIVSAEELLERMATLQASILAELARVLEMQQQGRRQVGDLEIKAQQLPRLEQADLDRLRGAELNQRQLTKSLTSWTEGVPMHIAGLLTDLENNRIDSADIRRRMEELQAEIDRLAAEHLPDIARELTSAIKAAQIALEPAPAGAQPAEKAEEPVVATALARAGEHQDAVIVSLEQLLGQLSRWNNFRKFHRDLSQLLRDHDELTRHTTELGHRSLGKELKALAPQEVADLKIAAKQQFELARRLDRILQEMSQAVEQLQPTDPLAAETVADALGRGRQLATAGKMRTAADSIGRNQMGLASERQYRVIEDLKELLDILSNRREQELGRLVEQLRQAEKDVAELAARQEQLQKRADEAAKQPNAAERPKQLERLAQQQEPVQQAAAPLARRLERLTAGPAGQALQHAAQRMQQAVQAARQGDAKAAQQQAQVAKEALNQAAQQLAQRRQEAEAELAMEQFNQLERAVRTLQQEEQKLLEETERLSGVEQREGQLERTDALDLEELARRQATAEIDARRLAERIVAAPVIRLALVGAAQDMAHAATLLDRHQLGAPPQQAEQHALERLQMVLDAIHPEAPAQPPPQQQPPAQQPNAANPAGQAGQGGKAAQAKAQANARKALIELKLTKAMQAEINHRTQELQIRYGQLKELPEEVRQEYQQLSEEQGKLAALLLQFIQSQQNAQPGAGAPARPKETSP